MPSFLTMDFATVTVQVDDNNLIIYKALLTAVSPYFENAFNGPSQEGDRQAIALEGISTSSFRIFLQWAYVQYLPLETQSAALGHSAMICQKDANKPAASDDEDGAVAKESDDSGDKDYDTASKASSGTAAQCIPIFHNETFHKHSDGEHKCWNDEERVRNTEAFNLTVLQLFILIDKYSVP